MRIGVDEEERLFGTENIDGQQAAEEIAAHLHVEAGDEKGLTHGNGAGAGKHVLDITPELAKLPLEIMLQFGRIKARHLALHGSRTAHDGNGELGKRDTGLFGKLVEYGRQTRDELLARLRGIFAR